MEELISRQQAIDALADYIHNFDKVYSTGKLSVDDCRDAAQSVFDNLPSAQPEIIRCKDCKGFKNIGCAVKIFDDSDRPTENDFCSFAIRRERGRNERVYF